MTYKQFFVLGMYGNLAFFSAENCFAFDVAIFRHFTHVSSCVSRVDLSHEAEWCEVK